MSRRKLSRQQRWRVEKIQADSSRTKYLTAQMALEYGIVDKVVIWR